MINESELRTRIIEHLEKRPGLPDVVLFWHAYVIALAEAGVIDVYAMDRLLDLPPQHDGTVVVEGLLGEEYFAEQPVRDDCRNTYEQRPNIVVDARKQDGMTNAVGARSIVRVRGADRAKSADGRGQLKNVTILTPEGQVTWSSAGEFAPKLVPLP